MKAPKNLVIPSAPLVTLGLVAYNQENYIREAVQSAFDQQCEGLEIILSDDQSSDRTFAIMQEMAANYRGPHTVRARQEPVNVGTVQHLINVAREASGQLLVVAAGDDISYPLRSQTLFNAWKATGAAALSSRHDEIDEKGKLLRKDVGFPPSEITQKLFATELQARRVDGKIPTVPGFCAAYPTAFWAGMPDPPHRLLVEDGIASTLIILRGGLIHRVPECLIAYRILGSSLTVRGNVKGDEALLRREDKISRSGSDLIHQIDYTLDLIARDGIVMRPATARWLRRARLHGEITCDFWSAGHVGRWARLSKVRTSYDASFLLPRLFGMAVFSRLRKLLKRD